MATRKIKPTIVDVPFVETPEQRETASAFAKLQAEFNNILGVTPQVTWKRAAIGWITSLLVCLGLGAIAGTLVGYMTIGALLLTGSTFIALAIYFLGMLASFYMGYRVGPIVYLAVVDKSVDHAYHAAKGWVTGLFSSTTPGVAA